MWLMTKWIISVFFLSIFFIRRTHIPTKLFFQMVSIMKCAFRAKPKRTHILLYTCIVWRFNALTTLASNSFFFFEYTEKTLSTLIGPMNLNRILKTCGNSQEKIYSNVARHETHILLAVHFSIYLFFSCLLTVI